MPRKGYIANLLAVPPLIFKFQFHPEMLSEKKSFDYNNDQDDGSWKFDKTAKAIGGVKDAKGVPATLAKTPAVPFGFIGDVPHFGPKLVATRSQKPAAGRPRTFALEFALDAREKPGEADSPVGRIEPDLAVLRSFMNPGFDLIRDIPALAGGSEIWKAPPTCDLKLGDIELTCVMNDLNIKITKFKSDLTPERAEVSLTLSEDTRSWSTVLDVVTRNIEAVKYLFGGKLTGEDFAQQIPGYGLAQNVFD
ncbi:MAG: hypothetical protein JST91_05475 [Actinobacteria bacterium]|nr:hypothetical protein [Actinomycetota bacterium]